MKNKKEWKPKVGDRVWVRLPMSATISRIYKDGTFEVETEDAILWSRYSKDEVEKISKQGRTKE